MNAPSPTPAPSLPILLWRLSMVSGLAVMLFFTFGIAPTLFAAFPKSVAGTVTEVLFPTYFRALYGCMLCGVLCLAFSKQAFVRWKLALGFLVLFGFAIGTIDFYLQPLLHDLRQAEDHARFARFHGISMLINLSAMIFLASALILPRTEAPVGRQQS